MTVKFYDGLQLYDEEQHQIQAGQRWAADAVGRLQTTPRSLAALIISWCRCLYP